jgi:hypothetical protein
MNCSTEAWANDRSMVYQNMYGSNGIISIFYFILFLFIFFTTTNNIDVFFHFFVSIFYYFSYQHILISLVTHIFSWIIRSTEAWFIRICMAVTVLLASFILFYFYLFILQQQTILIYFFIFLYPFFITFLINIFLSHL